MICQIKNILMDKKKFKKQKKPQKKVLKKYIQLIIYLFLNFQKEKKKLYK